MFDAPSGAALHLWSAGLRPPLTQDEGQRGAWCGSPSPRWGGMCGPMPRTGLRPPAQGLTTQLRAAPRVRGERGGPGQGWGRGLSSPCVSSWSQESCLPLPHPYDSLPRRRWDWVWSPAGWPALLGLCEHRWCPPATTHPPLLCSASAVAGQPAPGQCPPLPTRADPVPCVHRSTPS